MADEKKFKTFKEFWPEYLRLHSKPVTRAVHYAGTLGGVALAAAGVVFSAPLLIVAAPVVTYGLLFPAHPLFEKNRPATFRNPIMSIGGDFKMLFCFLTGKLKGEYEKHGLDYTGKTGNNQDAPRSQPAARPQNAPQSGLKSRLSKLFSKKASKPAHDVAVPPPCPGKGFVPQKRFGT